VQSNTKRQLAWCQANRARSNALKMKWAAKNPEKVAAYRQGFEARPEFKRKHAQRNREYRRTHKEWFRATKRNRRARELGAHGSCSAKQWRWRIEYYGWRCRYCKKSLTVATVTQDHVIPLARGGSHWPSNLVPACVSCNSKKYTKCPTWAKRK
jgi:hypothetical protein